MTQGAAAWIARGARQVSSGAAQRLFELFFLGQFFLVALVAPTFAAGSITGEKERKTYEMKTDWWPEFEMRSK